MEEEVKITETGSSSPKMEELLNEISRLKEENGKLKNATNNASADASKFKKALQEKMSEKERADAEAKEEIDRILAENAELKKAQTLSQHTNGWMSIGMDSELAKKAAEASVNNSFDALLETLSKYIEERDKVKYAEALKSTPVPKDGTARQTITAEEYKRMGYKERLKLLQDNPELYKELQKE